MNVFHVIYLCWGKRFLLSAIKDRQRSDDIEEGEKPGAYEGGLRVNMSDVVQVWFTCSSEANKICGCRKKIKKTLEVLQPSSCSSLLVLFLSLRNYSCPSLQLSLALFGGLCVWILITYRCSHYSW